MEGLTKGLFLKVWAGHKETTVIEGFPKPHKERAVTSPRPQGIESNDDVCINLHLIEGCSQRRVILQQRDPRNKRPDLTPGWICIGRTQPEA